MQPSCISWEDVLSPSYWTISKQLRASCLQLHLGLCAPIPGARGQTRGAGGPCLSWCSSWEGWHGGLPWVGGQGPAHPFPQSPVTGKPPHCFTHPILLPKGLVEDGAVPAWACRWHLLLCVPWVPWGSIGAVPETPLPASPGCSVSFQMFSKVPVGHGIGPCICSARYLTLTAYGMSQCKGTNKAWWRETSCSFGRGI